ncbi:MAG TPA: EcsC family protein [Bryobacteraceae bacterium]|nr:EcsC family protein [Bryobacteraceae bacterium]
MWAVVDWEMSEYGARSGLNPEDLAALRNAVRLLENPGFFIRSVNLIGAPIDAVVNALPAGAEEMLRKAISSSLERALDIALYRLEGGWGLFQQEKLMKTLVAASGAAGGAFGFAGLAVELPASTCLMLRSIAEIARAEGEDLRSPAGRLACLEVFALGGSRARDDRAETAYYAVRAGLGQEVRAALSYLSREPAGRAGAPALVRFIQAVAQRFGVQVTEKAAAQAIPAIGAVGGATINALFMDHFQDMAHGHFTVRRLERKYGEEVVRQEYSRAAGATAREHR